MNSETDNSKLDAVEVATDKSQKSIFKVCLSIFIWLTILLGICYFHPTKEVMHCDENFSCQIEQQFCHFLTIKKTLQLNNKSTLTDKIVINPWGGGKGKRSYNAYVSYDGKNPFIMFLDTNKQEGVVLSTLEKERMKFNNYLYEPNRRYAVASCADAFVFYIYMAIYIVLLLYFLLRKK